MSSWWIKGYVRPMKSDEDVRVAVDECVKDDASAKQLMDAALDAGVDEFYVVRTKERANGWSSKRARDNGRATR